MVVRKDGVMEKGKGGRRKRVWMGEARDNGRK